MQNEAKEIFLHTSQQYFLSHPAKTKVAICGRGFGKTSMDAIEALNCVNLLPRSRGFFLGLTYNQILTKFLPPITDFWERLGVKEHISAQEPGHYVVGVKPPTHFRTPFAKVKKYTNVISFFNGSYIELLSMDRKDLNLGGSYDWGLADEIQGVNRERFFKEYYVSVRGNIYRYNHPIHHRVVLTGTMPWLASGQWVLDFEAKAKESPKDVMYMARPAYDNIKALGADYFRKQKSELPPIIYEIEIENKLPKILSNGFYPEFSDEKHCYYDSYAYQEEPVSVNSLLSIPGKISLTDYDPTIPLNIAFDFGARVTCMIVAQETQGEIRIINCLYEKAMSAVMNLEEGGPKSLLDRILARFLQLYPQHRSSINIWGDHSGHNRSDRAPSSYEVVEMFFRKNNIFFTNNVERTSNPSHATKYQLINDALAGRLSNSPKIRINMNTCKPLILSIQASPVNNDYTKDKSSERNDLLGIEKQTHLSDAFDYLIYGRLKGNYQSGGGTSSIGTRLIG